jgi:hypothetical protein
MRRDRQPETMMKITVIKTYVLEAGRMPVSDSGATQRRRGDN